MGPGFRREWKICNQLLHSLQPLDYAIMSLDSLLTPAQTEDLRAIAAVMIPASTEFGVPGADDPAIQADIVATLGRDTELVRKALDDLARLAGRALASLDPPRRER